MKEIKIKKKEENEEYKNSESSSEDSDERKLNNEKKEEEKEKEKEKEIELSNISLINNQKKYTIDYNSPENFVLPPRLIYYKIPGYEIKKDENPKNQRIQKDFLIEDPNNIPDKNYYYPVGYLLKASKIHKIEDSTKHYRRIFRNPLEKEKEAFKLETPFIIRKIKRGKYKDIRKDTFLFEYL